MWIWASELHTLGFRRRSERYWQCRKGYELPGHGHLSIFSWSEQSIPTGKSRRYLVELTEFHVTFSVGVQHLHYYYHEGHPNEWHPAGYTSAREVRHVGENPRALRARADHIAGAFITALTGTLLPRRKE